MTGATADAAGTSGLVPAPAAGDQDKFLRADGTWSTTAGVKGSGAGLIVNGTGLEFTYSGSYSLFFYNIKGVSVPGATIPNFAWESQTGWLFLNSSTNKATKKIASFKIQTGATSYSNYNINLEISDSTVKITSDYNPYNNSIKMSGEVYAV